MSLNLSITSPAQTFTEPLTLAEVREYLNLPEISVTAAATLTFPEIPDGGSAALTFAMAGALAGDQLTPAWPSTLEAGLFGTMIVTADDTVQVRLFNLSGAAITPAPQSFSARTNSGSSGTGAMLLEFITAAREIAEILQGRDIVRKQYDLVLDGFCEEIELRDGLISVDLVRYRDSAGAYTTLVENTDFIVDSGRNPAIIGPVYNGSWPSYTAWPSGSVLVRFTAGPTEAMTQNELSRIKTGMRHLISAWYNNRLPFEIGSSEGMNEYAYTVSALFGFGSIPRIG